MEPVIEMRKASCFREGLAILDDVSLSFMRGECTVIMGSSGSGRSILLKTAAGIVPADRGSVLVDGRDVGKMSEAELFRFRGRCGFVFQDAALWANMSGYQNIALPLQFHRRKSTAADIRNRIEALVKEFDFRDNLSLRPASYSAGERKIVSFLRATALEPEILFLDNPTGDVDNASAERFLRILKRRKLQGSTLVMATHDPILTIQLADHLVVLKDGRVVEHGVMASVRKSTNPYVMEILSEVLSQAAAYDTDILGLLEKD